MKQNGLLTNINAVQDALRIYGHMVRTDADVGIRKKMADIAFRASENTYFTTKEKIYNQIANLPIRKDSQKRYGSTQYVGQYKLINWERKNRGLPTLGGSKFRMINTSKPNSMVYSERKTRVGSRLAGLGVKSNIYAMDGKYKSFRQARARSIKFIRAAWGVAAAFFGKPFTKGDFGPGALARFSGLAYGGAEVKKVGDTLIEYIAFNGAGKYDTRFNPPRLRSSSSQERAAKVIEDGLNKGIQFVLKDLTIYFEQRAKRYLDALKVINKLTS